jgi:hypothetical protein
MELVDHHVLVVDRTGSNIPQGTATLNVLETSSTSTAKPTQKVGKHPSLIPTLGLARRVHAGKRVLLLILSPI